MVVLTTTVTILQILVGLKPGQIDYLLKSWWHNDGNTVTSDAYHQCNELIFLTNGSSANCDIQLNGTWKISIQDGTTKSNQKIDMTTHKITNLALPTANRDAACKEYVDNASSSIDGGHFYVSSGVLYFEFD